MARLRIAIALPATAAEAQSLWEDRLRWQSWVDGFGHTASLDESWPEPGSTLVWDSPPGGRGRVLERLVGRSPGVEEREVEDERMVGRQLTSFTTLTDGVEVAVELRYELKVGGPLRGALDVLFVRRHVAESLRRTLDRLGHELAADRELLR